MSCHWVRAKELPEGRFWLPDCWGGLYGPEGCYCRSTSERQERDSQLAERIYKLEARLAVLEGRK